MKTKQPPLFLATAIGITCSSCTAYDSGREGEDDYEGAIEGKARAEEMRKHQQDSLDDIHDQSVRR